MYPYLVIGPLTISTYFLVISVASTVGAIWFLRRAENQGYSRVLAIDITLVCLISGFTGARLLHVFFEDFAYYRGAWSRIFEIWNGGFVFYGGLLGGLLGGAIYCKLRHIPFWFTCDLAIVPLSLTYAIGRLACFLNGCCYGKVCELPWAVLMNGERRHPTQLYASLWEVMTLLILLSFGRRLKEPGRLTGLWLILHSIGRVLMENFRDDPRGEMINGFSLATWISAVLFVAGVILVAPEMQKKTVEPT